MVAVVMVQFADSSMFSTSFRRSPSATLQLSKGIPQSDPQCPKTVQASERSGPLVACGSTVRAGPLALAAAHDVESSIVRRLGPRLCEISLEAGTRFPVSRLTDGVEFPFSLFPLTLSCCTVNDTVYMYRPPTVGFPFNRIAVGPRSQEGELSVVVGGLRRSQR